MYLSCGQIKPNQLIEIDDRPVVILSIRDTLVHPIKDINIWKRPDVERSQYLLTVKDYFGHYIYSIYDQSIINYKPIGFFGRIKLKLKKVFGG